MTKCVKVPSPGYVVCDECKKRSLVHCTVHDKHLCFDHIEKCGNVVCKSKEDGVSHAEEDE